MISAWLMRRRKLHSVMYSTFATVNERGVHFIPDLHLLNNEFESA
jgi:hypothetical protein